VDRDAHERPLGDRAPLECVREVVALETCEPRPEADVHRRRVLGLDAADSLQSPWQWEIRALEQQLAGQQGSVEFPLR
jgi:hypothetical protein